LLKKKRREEAKLVKVAVQPTTITRQCLKCDKSFQSEGDWICPTCTKINSHLCNGVDWHYFVSPAIGAAC
jgi:Zn finger protein HypA/HybF involved in hydrogenase expression